MQSRQSGLGLVVGNVSLGGCINASVVDTTDRFIAIFAIAEPVVLANDSIWVSKNKRGRSTA
jgi:hypothetical protein